MNHYQGQPSSKQACWARFRFSVIGHLLSAPPKSGELRQALQALSEKQWQHPITDNFVSFSFSTLERWFYQAQNEVDPIEKLRPKRRSDADRSRQLSEKLKMIIQQQYREHPSWSYQLHVDNLAVQVKNNSELSPMPSYSTILRYMKQNNYQKKSNIRRHGTAGAEKAALRLEQREVRGFEVEYVHGLWHLDFHHGKRKILSKDGQWYQPLLLAILDDHSRLICHAQWYFDETVETLVHGFTQALQKRGLPRALMSDNGSAMIAAEFTQGLSRLSILHQPTLPYSPYQNAKQEVFWAQIEGRLMAMLEGEKELTLPLLNQATIAWVEHEYHRKHHCEINSTPIARYLNDTSVGRTCPETIELKNAFCRDVKRKQRKSDGTFTLQGKRFEVPSRYQHLDILHVRYAQWDFGHVMLVDSKTDKCVAKLHPQDLAANANAQRRTLNHPQTVADTPVPSTGIAPLLKELMAEYAATGLPPAYIIKGE